MTPTAHYKRLVLELCRAYQDRDPTAAAALLTPDFQDTGDPFTGAELEIVGLVGEGATVVLRVCGPGWEQVQFFEGRDARLASRRCFSRVRLESSVQPRRP